MLLAQPLQERTVAGTSLRTLFIARNDQHGQRVIWTGVAVEDTADLAAVLACPPMRYPNRRQRPIVLALRGKAARILEQIRQAMNARRGRSRIARESHLELRLRKWRLFVVAFCRIRPWWDRASSLPCDTRRAHRGKISHDPAARTCTKFIRHDH